MKTILVVCPTECDKREIIQAGLSSHYRVLFYEYDDQVTEKVVSDSVGWFFYDFNPARLLANIAEYAQQHHVDAVIYSEDYPGSILGAITAQTIDVIGPNPRAVVGHQHKYYSRLWQQKYVPEATPSFCLIDSNDTNRVQQISLPIFLKPVKSFFSMLANEIRTPVELNYWLEQAQFPADFLEQFNWFVKHSSFDPLPHYLLAEELLRGEQCTLEGFVCDGEVTILGITDSIMFPGTISFKRFEYPSHLPVSVQGRMASIAVTLMVKTGFDNSFFNIEFMYRPETDRITIIEVNPRVVSQFADLYEKVDGINSYLYLAQLAVGEKPVPIHRKGYHALAGSCVLRIFENKRVCKAPGPKELERVYAAFPDARIQLFIEEGSLLSDVFQDGKSYRYGLVHLGARDSQELQEKFEWCTAVLGFEFEPV